MIPKTYRILGLQMALSVKYAQVIDGNNCDHYVPVGDCTSLYVL